MSHQDRREPLPKGYRFGDAKKKTVAPIEPWIREAYRDIGDLDGSRKIFTSSEMNACDPAHVGTITSAVRRTLAARIDAEFDV